MSRLCWSCLYRYKHIKEGQKFKNEDQDFNSAKQSLILRVNVIQELWFNGQLFSRSMSISYVKI